jgi:prolyl-tRNA editing enzyme YbaK/EbsC (Cys-tRNA(Pro) deacylase)
MPEALEHPSISRFRAAWVAAGGTGRIVVLPESVHTAVLAAQAKVAANLGVPRLRRATAEFVREHTGHVIGGVSPLDHPHPVPTYIDRALKRYDEIWAAAGHPAAVFSTNYDELRTLTGAVELDVTDTP